MRALRNFLIIALLALAVAVVPGGGELTEALLTLISMAFLAAIAFGVYRAYRQNEFAYMALDDRARTVLLGSIGVIALMIAGADELLETSLGTLLWIAALAGSAFAIYRVWVAASTY